MGLTTPQILGCCDFHKPSQNLVNAFKTDSQENLCSVPTTMRIMKWLQTMSIPVCSIRWVCRAFLIKYNEGYIIQKNDDWSRSKGLYGYYVSLKENVDPGL